LVRPATVVAEHESVVPAPGGCLRAYLQDPGYTRAAMVSSGLIDAQGRDRLWQAITFPIAETASMYGRHTGPATGRDRARCCRTVIVVEGLCDLASLWRAGFTAAVALLGTISMRGSKLSYAMGGRGPCTYAWTPMRTAVARAPRGCGADGWNKTGVRLLPVELPGGYDPNRFFAEGGSGAQFSRYLEPAGR
jgi:hypothetical protein